MFSLIGSILLFILIIIFLGLSIIGGVIKALFGIGRRSSSTHSGSGQSGNPHENRGGANTSSQTTKRKKIFEDDEGEYVDFEEVKDDKKKD